MKGRHERRLRQKTSWKSSGSLLAQKSSRSEKPASPKTFKWLKNRENDNTNNNNKTKYSS
ncbi:hypothetical protein YC2023_043014 [Brassica napus]